MIGVSDLLAGVDVNKSCHWSLFSFRFAPMCLLALGTEYPLDMTIERLHDPIRAIIGSPPRLHDKNKRPPEGGLCC